MMENQQLGDLPVKGGFEKRKNWRTDKRLITFPLIKRYCSYKQYDKHCLYYRCLKIERKPNAKFHPLCSCKNCPIWNELESNELSEEKRDNFLLEKIEKLIA